MSFSSTSLCLVLAADALLPLLPAQARLLHARAVTADGQSIVCRRGAP